MEMSYSPLAEGGPALRPPNRPCLLRRLEGHEVVVPKAAASLRFRADEVSPVGVQVGRGESRRENPALDLALLLLPSCSFHYNPTRRVQQHPEHSAHDLHDPPTQPCLLSRTLSASGPMLALPSIAPPVATFPVKFEDASPTRPVRQPAAETADWPVEEGRDETQDRIRWELRTEREEYIASLGEWRAFARGDWELTSVWGLQRRSCADCPSRPPRMATRAMDPLALSLRPTLLFRTAAFTTRWRRRSA